MPKSLITEMPDGSRWAVPVQLIAEHRARYYAKQDGDPFELCMAETNTSFDQDDYAIKDWASNNMNWSDVAPHAKRLGMPHPIDMQEGWVNGAYEVKELP